MKQHFLIKNGNKHLLLFFAGWGMDENPFRQIHPIDCDWMICYDYRSLEFDETLVEEYTHITLVAWSMGVWAASQINKLYPTLPISQRIAINGTLFPIDETKGITPAVFEGTLQGLNEQTLQKFQRRMCLSSDDFKAFKNVVPQRPLKELKEELASIKKQTLFLSPATDLWDIAFIGEKDRIFLPQNQKEAWYLQSDFTKEVEAAHYQQELFEYIFTTQQTYE